MNTHELTRSIEWYVEKFPTDPQNILWMVRHGAECAELTALISAKIRTQCAWQAFCDKLDLREAIPSDVNDAAVELASRVHIDAVDAEYKYWRAWNDAVAFRAQCADDDREWTDHQNHYASLRADFHL